jgi:type II secretory pathway pseudopilin PulG
MLEMVVVVLILGMIAAVASSRIFDTANDARKNSARQSLGVIRNAIDLYYQKNGEYPGQRGNDKEFKAEVRTMIRTPFPTCPIGNTNDKVHLDPHDHPLSAGGPKGWKYSRGTGEFIINHREYSTW